MASDREPAGKTCPTCSRCPIQECPAKDDAEGALLSGWRLGLASVGLFLGPVLLAIAGAMVSTESRTAQFLGAMAGLGAGLVGAVVVGRLLRRGRRQGP